MFIDGWRSFENGKYVDPMKINVLSVEGVYKRGDHIVVLIGTGAVYAKGTMESVLNEIEEKTRRMPT